MTVARSVPAEIEASRLLVIVAHPDDEILGCGALLAMLDDVAVVHVTGGAPDDAWAAREHGFATSADYAEARRREAASALAIAGIGQDRITGLHVTDQQVSLAMPEVARTLASMLAGIDIVLTHAFEGGHCDHDAVALAVHAACRLRPDAPRIVEMPFYHAAPDGWRRQRFLPHPDAGPAWDIRLDAAQRRLKQSMVDRHRTQAAVLQGFDLTRERFRPAPAYDFRNLPHPGDLLYERHGWNLTGALWVDRATTALAELRLG